MIPNVDIKDARESELGQFILAEFDKRCNQLMQGALEDREQGGTSDESVMEIEARIGVYDEQARAFKPGVGQKFFEGMCKYFCDKVKGGKFFQADNRGKPVKFVHTDHYDVQFTDNVRVTVKLSRKENRMVDKIDIVEVIIKSKQGGHGDFVVRSPQHGDRIHLRIGVAREDVEKSTSERYKTHVRAAKKAFMDAFNVSTSAKILGGIDITLNKKTPAVLLTFPPDAEQFARGTMGFSDPFYRIAHQNDNKLPGELARQLKWTLLTPSNLPTLGSTSVALHNKTFLDQNLFLTNMPGVVMLENNEPYSVFACQYIIRVGKEFILCGHGRFGTVNAADGDDTSIGRSNLEIKQFRRKRRWSFELRKDQKLDLTETQQTSNLACLHTQPKKYEVEIEKLLSSDCFKLGEDAIASNLQALHHADGFLVDIASRIYGFPLKVLDKNNLPSDQWRQQVAKDERRVTMFRSEWQQLSTSYGAVSRAKSMEAMDVDGGHGDDQQGAANFYNKLNRSSQASRSDSLIYHMRCLNNFVKSIAIKEAIQRMGGEIPMMQQRGMCILDLACGKGADIQKFCRATKEMGNIPISEYVGVDIARQSLDDAVERVESMRDASKFRIRFIEADLGNTPLSAVAGDENDYKLMEQWDSNTKSWGKQPPSNTVKLDERFDLVSMQFAFHYMFQKKERINFFFRTISHHLRVGGVFVSTTVCADEMILRLMQAGPDKNSFSITDERGVEACHVQFDENFRKKYFKTYQEEEPDPADGSMNGDSMNDMTGIRYHFTLRDGEDDAQQAVAAPEWLIPIQLLIKLATAYHFQLVRYERLPNAAARYMERDSPNALYRRMNVLNHEGSLSKAEWEIASLYVVVELVKEGKPSDYVEGLKRFKDRVPGFEQLPAAERNELIALMMRG